jgi:hypothetical protein
VSIWRVNEAIEGAAAHLLELHWYITSDTCRLSVGQFYECAYGCGVRRSAMTTPKPDWANERAAEVTRRCETTNDVGSDHDHGYQSCAPCLAAALRTARAEGGLSILSNYVLACKECNVTKGHALAEGARDRDGQPIAHCNRCRIAIQSHRSGTKLAPAIRVFRRLATPAERPTEGKEKTK